MSRLLRLILLIVLVLAILIIGFRCSQLAKEHGATGQKYNIVPTQSTESDVSEHVLVEVEKPTMEPTLHNTQATNNQTLLENTKESESKNNIITEKNEQKNNEITEKSNTLINLDANQQKQSSLPEKNDSTVKDQKSNMLSEITEPQSHVETRNTLAETTNADVMPEDNNAHKLVPTEQMKIPSPNEIDRSPGDLAAANASKKAKAMQEEIKLLSNQSTSNAVTDENTNQTIVPTEPPQEEVIGTGAVVAEPTQDNLKIGSAIILEKVTFASGSTQLATSSLPELDKIANILKNDTTRIEIAGFTDNTGSVEANERISLERADTVRNYLIQKGVSATRLISQGYGPSSPIADNSTAAGRKKNRRVELQIK